MTNKRQCVDSVVTTTKCILFTALSYVVTILWRVHENVCDDVHTFCNNVLEHAFDVAATKR